jgi:hypothetical protein
MNTPIHRCSVCGSLADTAVVGYEIDGIWVALPQLFVFAYRQAGKPLGLCNLCFEARRFDGFTPAEIAYFQEEFAKPNETPNA